MIKKLVPATLVLGLLSGTFAEAGVVTKTRRVSVRSNGNQSEGGGSFEPTISGTGRFVAFHSNADNLVPNDDNSASDVFVHDRRTGKTTRVSVKSNGNEGGTSLGSEGATMTPDGRYIVFESSAKLAGSDDNAYEDVYLHDRATGKTRLISVKSNGDEAETGDSYDAEISANGKVIAFTSAATDLVPNDGNAATDVFVHVLSTGKTKRVSVKSNGDEAPTGDSYSSAVSGNGRLVAFTSIAVLVTGDDNNEYDVLMHDRETKKTRRISVQSDGDQAGGPSSDPEFSASGGIVSYESHAEDLVPNDGNTEEDIFVYVRRTKKTRRVSVSSTGEESDGSSEDAGMSSNGRFIVFESTGTNLVGNDENSLEDCFMYDRRTKKTRRLSLRNNGQETLTDGSDDPDVSNGGKFVAFESRATDLAGPDTNTYDDIFVRGPLP